MENDKQFLPYNILRTGGSREIVEKKSRFIATLAPVKTKEEAAAFIESMKKQYWDASHNCSAFVIGGDAQLTRCSDDGEPSGTAGKPMLEALLSAQVSDAAVVVTRYFGGTLLGTGGLVRAYTRAVCDGLAACGTSTMRYGVELFLTTDYNGIGKVLHLLEQPGVQAGAADYAELVRLNITVPFELYHKLRKELTEATAGKIRIEEKRKYYFVSS